MLDGLALAPVPALHKRERKGAMIALAGALPPAQIPPEALASPRHDRLLAGALVVSCSAGTASNRRKRPSGSRRNRISPEVRNGRLSSSVETRTASRPIVRPFRESS